MGRVLVLGSSCRWDLEALGLAQNSRGWLGEPTSCSSQEPRAPEFGPDAQNHGEQGETHVTKEEAKGLPRPWQGHSPPGRAAFLSCPLKGAPWLRSLAAPERRVLQPWV